jgi:hypothetical protein
MGLLGSIIAAILVVILGLWLALSGLHLILTIIGWVLVIAAALWVIQVLFSSSRTRL